MEIATNAKLRQLYFARAEDFTGAADRVISRMIEIVDVVGVNPEFAGEDFGIKGRLGGTRIPGQPGKVGKGKRFGFLGGYLRRSGDGRGGLSRRDCCVS